MTSRNEYSETSKPGPSFASGSSAETKRKIEPAPRVFPSPRTSFAHDLSIFETLSPMYRRSETEEEIAERRARIDRFNEQVDQKKQEQVMKTVEEKRELEARMSLFNEQLDADKAVKEEEVDDEKRKFQDEYKKLIELQLYQDEEVKKEPIDNEAPMDVDEPHDEKEIKEEPACEVALQERRRRDIHKKAKEKARRSKEKKKEKRRSSGKHQQRLSGGGPNGVPPPRMYKVVFDPHTASEQLKAQLKTKDFVRRHRGKCGEKYKQFDYPQAPSDPRLKFRRVDQPKNLIVPNLTVDDQYTGIPPKREVTISNLNDNVNKEFLLKMTRGQKLEPQDVIIFHHPVTKKHLKMAHILFKKSKDASAFVDANDGVSVMGEAIGCKLDPFAADLAYQYTKLAGESLPALPYLSAMSEHELSLRREKLVGSTYIPISPEMEAPLPAAAPFAPAEEEMRRSLSPMDTSNSPLPVVEILTPHKQRAHYEPPPPMQPQYHHHQHHYQPPPQHQQPYVDDAGASTSKTPPPPYSELPPTHHGMYDQTRSDSRSRRGGGVGESEDKTRRDKRRHASTSSSTSYSSGGEGSHGGRRRSDGGVKKKREEEYLKVSKKRYVSSERDSNGGAKRVLNEVKTVTYKRRTEQRTTIPEKKVSPDSFDEEMKRRERSKSRSTRNSERGKDEMRWSSPSSDSDNGGRRKRGKERASESHSHDGRHPQHPADPTTTPSSSSYFPGGASASAPPSASSRGRRSRGFHAAPAFDPSHPPPPFVVPPIGLVTPDCANSASSASHPPPSPATIPLPPPNMMAPPPPLPGGFIPPPEFFGLHSTPAMISAFNTAPGGMTPGLLPPGLPMPPMMMGGMTPMGGGPGVGGYGGTPRPNHHQKNQQPHQYSSPARPQTKLPQYKMEEVASAVSSPSTSSMGTGGGGGGMQRASSSSSLTTMSAAARTPSDMKLGYATPTTPSEGGPTPQTNTAPGTVEKKVNLDDRLSMIFGLKKAKKEDEAREMKHAASAPSIAAMATTAAEQRARADDDMEVDDYNDDDMDVASSSSSQDGTMITSSMDRRGGEQRRETEEEMRRKEEAEMRRMEEEVVAITEFTLKKIVQQLEQQTVKDLDKKLEATAMKMMEEWLDRQKVGVEERKKQMIRESLAQAAAREEALVTPYKDPMEAMLAAKLLSPEGLSSGGISAHLSSMRIVKIKSTVADDDVSRDGTPASRDDLSSRPASGLTKSRSSSTSSRSSRSSVDSSSSSEEEDDEVEARKGTRRPNKRNIESSQSSAASTVSDSGSESSDEDSELDVVGGVTEDDKMKQKCASPAASHAAGPSTPPDVSALAAPSAAADDDEQMPLLRAKPQPAAMMQRAVQQADPTTVPGGGPSGQAPSAARSPLAPISAALSIDAPLLKPKKPKAEKKKPLTTHNGAMPQQSTPYPTKAAYPPAKRDKKKMIFAKRPEEEEERVRESFKAGMDGEDEYYTKTALDAAQADGARPFPGYAHEVPFESHLRAYTPRELPVPYQIGDKLDLYYDDTELAGIVPHSMGCARAQGFYRLTTKQKIRIMRRPEAFQDRTEINERDEVVSRHQVQAQKEQRSMNRRLQTMVDSNPNSEFFKVNQLKYRKKMIKFARSRIHGWGLYALEPIAPDDMIVEYIGQKIRPSVADEREKAYERRGIGSSYLFRIDEDEVIDATKQGNFARFINHSCQPNCYAKVMTVDSDKRIVIYSKTLIQKGDEITYDYKFPIEVEKIECLCGAPLCRGSLN